MAASSVLRRGKKPAVSVAGKPKKERAAMPSAGRPSFVAGFSRALAVATGAPVARFVIPRDAIFPKGFRRTFSSALHRVGKPESLAKQELSRIAREAEAQLKKQLSKERNPQKREGIQKALGFLGHW
ncbi:MAG: hypothetical protein QT03_C0001G0802 [archaeon GW2011_AR10]|uniref:Uncharacterized protein n=1 Tax=Candidatus Iainarchaeum sp. TaxID=3101447 RepID=A0A7J4IV20_9ARCH|nr:MAG: hypothetical protein QT03_C0001G0802 [archaeon GW2011_AR10]HIH08670.1 hypothetical protein [Candidatus Diapherotrites archaeon]